MLVLFCRLGPSLGRCHLADRRSGPTLGNATRYFEPNVGPLARVRLSSSQGLAASSSAKFVIDQFFLAKKPRVNMPASKKKLNLLPAASAPSLLPLPKPTGMPLPELLPMPEENPPSPKPEQIPESRPTFTPPVAKSLSMQSRRPLPTLMPLKQSLLMRQPMPKSPPMLSLKPLPLPMPLMLPSRQQQDTRESLLIPQCSPNRHRC